MADGSRPKVLSLDAARAERLYVTHMELLEAYCMVETDSPERERAIERFFGGECDLANLPDSGQDEFLDWFAFSYRTEETGETMLERFDEEHQRLTGQGALPGLYQSRFSFYRVDEQKGYRHTLSDCLTGEQFLLSLESEIPAPKGSLFCGRIIPVGAVWRPGFTLDTIPPDFFAEFQPLLASELERMRLAFPEAGWSELLRERWPLIRDLMLMRTEHEPLRLSVPELPPAPSPSGESVPGSLEVAFALQGCAERMGLAKEDTQRLIRLWYDAAALLQPAIRKPETWAAGVVWAYQNWVEAMPLPHAAIAELCEVSVASVGPKGRQIGAALGLVQEDDRYTDPLTSTERMKRLVQLFGMDAINTLYE
ncbi:MAG TPA: hypothetical protein VK191_02415 [Symbiobacteriaceae bacterium]|nr:hypothetical protein [Symbiobacteriaceae bacterium]